MKSNEQELEQLINELYDQDDESEKENIVFQSK